VWGLNENLFGRVLIQTCWKRSSSGFILKPSKFQMF
jgi:hypothetical protein